MAYGERLNKNLGLIVRLRMMTASINQSALASALGVQQTAVSRRLHGHQAIPVTELPIIAALLDTTPGDLIEEAWSATIKELGKPASIDAADREGAGERAA